MRSDHGYGLGPVPSSRMMATRVMIVGGSGSGKSFLALKLSELAHLPSYHMDQLSWRPGFVQDGSIDPRHPCPGTLDTGRGSL
jgi:hypothetical protein